MDAEQGIKWLYAGHFFEVWRDEEHDPESCGFCAVVGDVIDAEQFRDGLDESLSGIHPLMHYLLEKGQSND